MEEHDPSEINDRAALKLHYANKHPTSSKTFEEDILFEKLHFYRLNKQPYELRLFRDLDYLNGLICYKHKHK